MQIKRMRIICVRDAKKLAYLSVAGKRSDQKEKEYSDYDESNERYTVVDNVFVFLSGCNMKAGGLKVMLGLLNTDLLSGETLL
ncbi:MAG: hypothetical protein HYW13_03945 [Planctomycetes bacterium]|nr:hypothetical protein [Planctomycetota bacterium]